MVSFGGGKRFHSCQFGTCRSGSNRVLREGKGGEGARTTPSKPRGGRGYPLELLLKENQHFFLPSENFWDPKIEMKHDFFKRLFFIADPTILRSFRPKFPLPWGSDEAILG